MWTCSSRGIRMCTPSFIEMRPLSGNEKLTGAFCRFQAIQYDNKFFVNPGTATGAWTGSFNGYIAMSSFIVIHETNVNFWRHSDPIPSFALMDIQGSVVVTYVYQLIEGEVRVEKIEWRKETEPLPPLPRNLPSANQIQPQASLSPSMPGSPSGGAVW
jgi:vacuolar protein sorting-associated protein 29